jgi:hypothetical protein
LKNVNLTNVRSAIDLRLAVAVMALASALAGASPAAHAAPASPPPRVVLVLLNGEIAPEELAAALPGVSPGLLSAGLSTVRSTQSYLDISQGNRIFTSLYPVQIPSSLATAARVPGWRGLVDRSERAPANLVPGLLGGSLAQAGIPIHVDPSLRTPALLAADRDGVVGRGPPGECVSAPCPPGFDVILAARAELPAIAARLGGDDLLIAMQRPPAPGHAPLTLGILGRGFDGNLTSDTTRTPGLVASTDLLPTILARFGVPVPAQVSGNPIRSEGAPDAAAVGRRGERLAQVGERRDPVIFTNALIWLALALAAIALSRGRLARRALELLALAYVYLPLLLLLGAALQPSEIGERLIVGLGAPLLAMLTLRFVRGYAALALACGVTVAAYAIDVAAGSPLTSLSLIGPNPALGVRFFGIGNELEAAVAVLVPVAVGAALSATAAGEADSRRRTSVLAFLGVGAVTAVIFGLGRFGADVGAVIVLPIGAAVAAAVVSGAASRRRTLLLVIAAPVLALAALAALDLALGGGAHLTSSVLRAGGASSLADVAERRLRLSVSSFVRNTDSPYLYLSVVVAIAAIARRRLIESWFEGRPAAFAGLCGAAAATVIGTLANDSGALLLMIGTAYLVAITAFAWAQAPKVAGEP